MTLPERRIRDLQYERSRLHNGMTALVGGFTCALGVFIVYHIGFVEGLLRG